jgi:hypothetical protein
MLMSMLSDGAAAVVLVISVLAMVVLLYILPFDFKLSIARSRISWRIRPSFSSTGSGASG